MNTAPKSNIRLLTGDKYFIDKQLKERIFGFGKVYGDGNVLKINPDEFDSKFVIENIWGGGLFASRKMIIIYDIPLMANKSLPAGVREEIDKFISYFMKNIDTIDTESITLIFACSTPDKRTIFFKFLTDNKNNVKSQNMKYDKSELEKLIEESIGGIYEDNQKQYLYNFFEDYYKNDLYSLENELWKLKNYDGKLDIKDIKQICYYSKKYDLFSLIEDLLSPEINMEEKNRIIENIKLNDDNPFSFLGLFGRNIISILNLVDGIKSGYTDYKLLMSKVKIHPFAFGKLYKQKNIFITHHDKIINILDSILELEYKIKTGILPQEYFWSGFKEIME